MRTNKVFLVICISATIQLLISAASMPFKVTLSLEPLDPIAQPAPGRHNRLSTVWGVIKADR